MHPSNDVLETPAVATGPLTRRLPVSPFFPRRCAR